MFRRVFWLVMGAGFGFGVSFWVTRVIRETRPTLELIADAIEVTKRPVCEEPVRELPSLFKAIEEIRWRHAGCRLVDGSVGTVPARWPNPSKGRGTRPIWRPFG